VFLDEFSQMSWSESLIKLATYEVENRQLRLAEIAKRRADAETRLAVLVAEGEAETKHASQNAEAGWYMAGYAEGLKIRKAALLADIDAIQAEERGARDALAQAFEEQKKYEQVADSARRAEVKEANRRENAELDEVGMRAARRAGGNAA
jgi:flagellar FliJ protein